jgi:hypothetical protein
MTGPIPLQSGAIAPDKSGLPTVPAREAGSSDAFTMLLSDSIQKWTGPESQLPVVATASNPPTPSSDITKKPGDHVQTKVEYFDAIIADLHGSISALPSGKTPRSGSGRPIRTDQASGTDAAPGVQAAMGQSLPGIAQAVPDVAFQAQMAVVSLPLEVPMQRPASVTSTTVTEDDVQNSAGSHRPDLPWSRDAQVTVLDDPASVTSPVALSLSDARLETFAVPSHAASVPTTLTAPSDIPQAISYGTGSLPPLPDGHGQPAVFADRTGPTDQITPTLGGIPRTTDSASSVIVHPQPTELSGSAIVLPLDKAVRSAARDATSGPIRCPAQMLSLDARPQWGKVCRGSRGQFLTSLPRRRWRWSASCRRCRLLRHPISLRPFPTEPTNRRLCRAIRVRPPYLLIVPDAPIRLSPRRMGYQERRMGYEERRTAPRV